MSYLLCVACNTYHETGVACNMNKITGPNPKEAMGAAKAPMNACPNTALAELYNVMGGGAHKYGLYNFRDTDISAQTYIGAIRRHLFLWEDGTDTDEESGMSHLAHIMACCALAIDAGYTGKLIDDRSKTGLMPSILKKSAYKFNQYKTDNKSAEERSVGKDQWSQPLRPGQVIEVNKDHIPLDPMWNKAFIANGITPEPLQEVSLSEIVDAQANPWEVYPTSVAGRFIEKWETDTK